MMEAKIHMKIDVQFNSKTDSKLIYDTLLPEITDHDFERSQISIELDGSCLILDIVSQDTSAAKANINSVLRLVSLVSESIELVPKTIVKRNP